MACYLKTAGEKVVIIMGSTLVILGLFAFKRSSDMAAIASTDIVAIIVGILMLVVAVFSYGKKSGRGLSIRINELTEKKRSLNTGKPSRTFKYHRARLSRKKWNGQRLDWPIS